MALLVAGAAVAGLYALGIAYFFTSLILGGWLRGIACLAAYALLLGGGAMAWTRFARRYR